MKRQPDSVGGESSIEATYAVEFIRELGAEALTMLTAANSPGEAPDLAWDDFSRDKQEPWAHELWQTIFLEGCLPSAGMLTVLPPSTAQELHTTIDAYHDALPFSPAERRWLTDEYGRRDAQDAAGNYADAIHGLDGAKGEIISDGKQQQVRGDELVRRWWDWRRGAGTYKEVSAVDVARNATARMIHLLLGSASLREGQ